MRVRPDDGHVVTSEVAIAVLGEGVLISGLLCFAEAAPALLYMRGRLRS